MMKKGFKLTAIFLLVLLIIGLVANYKYNFYTEKGDGWSIGFNTINSVFEEDPVKDGIILHKDWLKSHSSSKTRFLADPFVFVEDNVHYIFFEHQAAGNADVGLLKSYDGKNFLFEGNVLDENFHLSFPQVFKFRGDYYMVPESKQAGQVLLYKAENFPYDWTIFDTLIKNVELKDPAILISDSINLLSLSDDDLRQTIYSADSLTGIWKKDTRFKDRYGDETRAGGNFFQVNGEWYLPLQKNNRGYGSGISIYKLRYDDEEMKLEKQIDSYLDKIDSIKWFNRGMHHLSVYPYEGNYKIVFDGDVKAMGEEKTPSWKASLKYNYYDLRRLIIE
jgi:hypothetical protein